MIAPIIIGLTLAMASASAADRGSRVRTAIALGEVPDLTEIIDSRGLKMVSDRVQTMSDGRARELMLRGIQQWLEREDIGEASLYKMMSILQKAVGARVVLFNSKWSDDGGPIEVELEDEKDLLPMGGGLYQLRWRANLVTYHKSFTRIYVKGPRYRAPLHPATSQRHET